MGQTARKLRSGEAGRAEVILLIGLGLDRRYQPGVGAFGLLTAAPAVGAVRLSGVDRSGAREASPPSMSASAKAARWRVQIATGRAGRETTRQTRRRHRDTENMGCTVARANNGQAAAALRAEAFDPILMDCDDDRDWFDATKRIQEIEHDRRPARQRRHLLRLPTVH
jgi:hypothetical protein